MPVGTKQNGRPMKSNAGGHKTKRAADESNAGGHKTKRAADESNAGGAQNKTGGR